MADIYQRSETIRCLYCGKENPPKAYCCLGCFKVLRPKEKIPWWRAYIKPTFPMMALFVGVSLAAIFMFKRWMENIEAQVTMNFKSNNYKVSLVADKKKKQTTIDFDSSDPTSASAQ